jgi:hypothetical protein
MKDSVVFWNMKAVEELRKLRVCGKGKQASFFSGNQRET